MVKKANIELEWADGEYLFALKMDQIEELEAISPNPATGKNGIGFGDVWTRIMGGSWYFKDIRNVVRLGLIGGGMGAIEANRMCKTYIDGLPISRLDPDYDNPNCPLLVAQAILKAAVVGVEPDNAPGEQEPPEA